MFRSIPWDVWIAATLAATVSVVAVFDPGPAVFIVLYLGLCAYITVQAFGSERDM